MMRHARHGVANVEFALVSLVALPLLLGVGVTGIDLIRTLQTIQLARDAGHMFARGVDFSQPGNKTILTTEGADLNLTTASNSPAVLILSRLTYVDTSTCAAAGAVDAHGNPSGCTNWNQWVFRQRLVIGGVGLRTSAFGSPLTGGPTGVTVDPATGMISLQDCVTKAGAVATFSGINPYSVVDGKVSGLPSGESLYVSEAAAKLLAVPPFVGEGTTYSYGLF
jgi:hypothetical protein